MAFALFHTLFLRVFVFNESRLSVDLPPLLFLSVSFCLSLSRSLTREAMLVRFI